MTAAIVLFLFGGITTLLSLQLSVGTLRAPGSGFFPFVLGLMLMGLSAGHALRLHLAGRELPTGPETDRKDGVSTRQVLRFMGAVVAGTALLEPLGFLLVSFLLMVALLWGLGIRWHVSGLIALPTALGSYLLFVQWLQIPLPRGWIWP
jgi:hypothetical protein